MHDWDGNGDKNLGDQSIFDDLTKSEEDESSGFSSSGNSKILFWFILFIVCAVLNMIFGSIGTYILVIAIIIKFYKWVTRD